MDIHKLVGIEMDVRYLDCDVLFNDAGYKFVSRQDGEEYWSKDTNLLNVPATKTIHFYKNDNSDWMVESWFIAKDGGDSGSITAGFTYREVRIITRRMYELMSRDYGEELIEREQNEGNSSHGRDN